VGTKVLILAGTVKGGFILESDETREEWQVRGPFCNRFEVSDMQYDKQSGAIYAASFEEVWPRTIPAVWKSTDMGETWSNSAAGITYGEELPMKRVWSLMPAHGALYAGVEPAGLFRSEDGGASWQHMEGLRQHPTTPEWIGGYGGLCLHSIVANPTDPNEMWVGISSAGGFHTADRGRTWHSCNKGIRNPYAPDPMAEHGY
jgi:hypothetical protein